MSNQQHIAVVSMGGRVLHAVGPFPDSKTAFIEGRKVAEGVEMFRLPEDEEGAHVVTLPLVQDLGALLSLIPAPERPISSYGPDELIPE